MVIDSIRNAHFYYSLHPGIEKALRFLETQDLLSMQPGRHDIDGDNCFAMVSDYDTVPVEQKRWEAHRRYLDVQYVASGEELMGYADIEALKAVEEYSDANDIIWLQGEGSFVLARTGTFVILAPQDAHMPGVAAQTPEHVRKVVVKVLA